MENENLKHRPAKTSNDVSMRQYDPSEGDVVILSSDDWRVFESGVWREMTFEEQESLS